jgi:thermitase
LNYIMRKILKSVIVISLIVIAIFIAAPAFAQEDHAPNEVIVKLKSGFTLDNISSILNNYSIKQEKIFNEAAFSLSNIYLISFNEEVDVVSIVNSLKINPYVEYGQINHFIELCMVPNDQYADSSASWGNSYKDMWGAYQIKAPEAWDITTGSENVIVAVIDTGVDYDHEDLSGRVIKGFDFSDYDSDPKDKDGHGTHVAGIIAANGNNNIGIAGVAWGCKVLAIKIFPYGTEIDAASAIKYALDQGAKIINMSWRVAGTNQSPVLNDLIQYAASKNIVLVAAAGNDGNDVSNCFPANHPEVMAVASTDNSGNLSSFSNRGTGVAVAAPGGGGASLNLIYNVLSLKSSISSERYNSFLIPLNYLRLGGTSMSAAYVSGVAALILSKNQNLSKREVETKIRDFADDLGDTSVSFGRVNALNALNNTSPANDGDGDSTGGKAIKTEPPDWVKNIKVGDIAFDNGGNMYVLYTNQLKVVKYNTSGKAVGTIESFNGDSLWYPLGLAVSPSGDHVYVADTFKNRVLIYDADLGSLWSIKARDVYFEQKQRYWDSWSLGFHMIDNSTYITELEILEEGYQLPIDVKVQDGNIYVTDAEKHRVLKYNKYGKEVCFEKVIVHIVEKDSSSILGSERKENWYRSNALNDTMKLDNPSGLIGYPAGFDLDSPSNPSYQEKQFLDFIYHYLSTKESNADGKFSFPESVAIDPVGNIYVSDTGNNRVQLFSPDGSFSAKFGEGILNSPKGIDVDSNKNIWVADAGNKRIVQFNALGEFVKEYKSNDHEINPQKILVREGKLYIADANSNEPLIWNIAGDIINIRVSDSWFSPNSDNVKDSTKISYDLSQPAKITIQAIPITAEGSAAESIILNNVSRDAGRHEEIWDGKISKGDKTKVLADGRYKLKISAAFGDYIKTKSFDINIDTQKPTLGLNRDPPGISPNSDGVKDKVSINCSLSDNLSPTSDVKLSITKDNRILNILLDENKSCAIKPITWSASWDGKYGGNLEEGIYLIKLEAKDLAGNLAIATREVIVDINPPRIEALSLSNDFFSPNADGRKDNTEISFNLYDTFSSAIYATVQVEDENGQLITKVIEREELVPGEHSFAWDGTRDSAVVVSDGEYTIKVYAEDLAGNLAKSDPKIVVVDTVPPAIKSLTASPNPFTPNNDGIKDTTTFNCEMSEPAIATLNIYNAEGILFQQFVSPETFAQTWVWDGRGSHYELLGGEYTYNLLAEDRAGNQTTSETHTILIDYSASLVPYIFANPDPFSPINPDNSVTNINYNMVRDNVRVTLDIIGQNEQRIKRLVDQEIQNRGEHSIQWDGGFEDGYSGPKNSKDPTKVTDGTYEFRIYAEDLDGGEPGDITNTVLIDTVPPHIILYPVEIDCAGRSAALKYSLPEEATVKIEVNTAEDEPISTLVNNEKQSAGEYRAEFSVAESAGNSMCFKVVTIDRALNQDEKTSQLFSLTPQTGFQINSYYATPNPFTPNGDGHTDLARINYRISGGAPDYTVNIEIVNEIGTTVKSLIVNEPQLAGSYSFNWDGMDDSRLLVDDGNYEYVITAIDKQGARVKAQGSILVVSTRPTVDLCASLAVFSPNGDGVKDTVRFDYSIDYSVAYITGEALVKLEIINSAGEVVWEKIFNHTAGSYYYEYNGTAANGLPLAEGDYYVRIKAEDALGSTAVPKTVDLRVENENPLIEIQSIAPNPFSPQPNGRKDQTVITYTVSKNSEVEISVEGIKELYRGSVSAASSGISAYAIPTITWDGRDSSGGLVADGIYNITIVAADVSGNNGNVNATVAVDNTAPEIPTVNDLPANTNLGSQNIAGMAEPNAEVEVYINDSLATAGVADGFGNFSIPIALSLGGNLIKVCAVDPAGNVSNFSRTQTVNYETDGPIISAFEVSPNSAKAGPVTIHFTVSETLESNPTVTLNGNPVEIISGIQDPVSSVWSYECGYNVTEMDAQGTAVIRIEVEDLAHNVTTQQFNNLVIDTVAPTVFNLDITPEHAKLATEVIIDFSVSETLIENANIGVGGSAATFVNRTAYSPERIDYSYAYLISEGDLEGAATITIDVTDVAGNQTNFQSEQLIIDKTSPEVKGLRINPNPASIGEIIIGFDVSEALNKAPVVSVIQNGAASQMAIISGSWGEAGGQVEARHEVISGFDGPALINIELEDLAKNLTNHQNSELMIDTIAPEFTNIQSEISTNPDFSNYAKEGSEVTIRFRTSEELKFNPDVRVNCDLAEYLSLISDEYAYRYAVTSSDGEGNANITISGIDFAGNEGTTETSSSAESFVIDLTNPTIMISADPGLIANPGHFSTNASPDEAALKTSLRYEISEPGFVTTKVYKINNSQIDYTRDDFLEGNLVDELESDVYRDTGTYYKDWNGSINFNQSLFDLNNNNYADPGKYAFIVEVRDRAGNLTQHLWGGTVWIQDNVLKVQEPDQQVTGGTNPRPKYFSPKNHPGDEAYGYSSYWFKVLLGITPKSYEEPERIEVFAIEDDYSWLEGMAKKVGHYTVRVYDETGNQVRAVESGECVSATNYVVKWDGKNDGGQFVADGKYYFKVDVRDYLNGQAFDNYLTREVYVDNTYPQIIDNQAGDETWRNVAGTLYDVDFRDPGIYPAKISSAKYRIKKPDGTFTNWVDIPGVNGAILFDTNWAINFDSCAQGTNYVYVNVEDQTGNLTEPADPVFYVKKDTVAPTSISQPSSTTPTNDRTPVWNWMLANDMSGIAGYYIKVGTSAGGDDLIAETWVGDVTSWETTVSLSDGTYYAAIKAKDNAGNVSSYGPAGSVVVDLIAPQITGISDSPDPFSPGNIDGNKDSITINYSINEASTVSIYVDGTRRYNETKTSAGSYNFSWAPGTSINEGTHSYYIQAQDLAGNTRTSASYNFLVDNTPPPPPTGLSATSSDRIANLSWNPVGGADGYRVYRSSAYNGTYSDVSGLIISTSYQNTGLSSGTRYWYKVLAVDEAGNESLFLDNVPATPGNINLTKLVFAYGLIYKMNIDESNRVNLSTSGGLLPQDWSLDGNKIIYIAYDSDPSNWHYYIRKMNADGSNKTDIVHNINLSIGFARISPDGTKIAYSGGESDLFVVNIDGTGKRKIASSESFVIGWSPDGGKIYYVSAPTPQTPHGSLWAISLLDLRAQVIVSDFVGIAGGRISPDGTKIAYTYDRGVFIVNLDGTNNYMVTSDPDMSDSAVYWAPSGTRLVYACGKDSTGSIKMVDVDGSNKTEINCSTTGCPSNPIWSPFVTNMSALGIEDKIVSYASAEALILVSPKDETEVRTLRPSFEWQHRRGNTEEYKIELAKNDAFTIDLQSFTKSANTGSVDKDDPNLYHFTYQIHEFDPGLDRDTYYWRVSAIASDESAVSDIWSFTVAPELTLTKVTNYPNPFNPNRESTSIRYRLGADADEVKVHIYDISGSLVKEIPNCPTEGEGSSIWDKYQDVEWDGRNGRGDLVMNGIYPFEVTARLGDKSFSARGRIAVLK